MHTIIIPYKAQEGSPASHHIIAAQQEVNFVTVHILIIIDRLSSKHAPPPSSFYIRIPYLLLPIS